ncbi:MAG: right-handed parallel beta-helix repeat-containing protein [Synechococcaceae cyanobacterium RM1_1_27]|nr:right-handed parallel beta-helix repeat-containing protein [Synechococcaceae cyanobacterium RM1_1_27]
MSSPEGGFDGSSAATPTTLAGALDIANSGNTIILAAGSYQEGLGTLTLDIPNLTLQGAGIGETTIAPSSSPVCMGVSIEAANITIADLTLDGSQVSGSSVSCVSTTVAILAGGSAASGLTLNNLAFEGTNPAPSMGSVDLPTTDAANGVELTGLNGATLTNLEINNADQTGIQITDATGTFSVADSIFNNSGSRAIFFEDVNGTVTVSNNSVDGALNEGIFLRNVTGTGVITDNTVQDIRYRPTPGGGSGIEGGIIHTNTLGVVNTTVSSNTVTVDPNGETLGFTGEPLLDIDGIEVNMFDTAVGFAIVENNTVSDTDDDGIDSDADGTAVLDITIRNNTISGIQDRGISFVSTEMGTMRGLIEDNQITGPDEVNTGAEPDGIGIRPRGESEMDITVRNNTVTNQGRKGIDINLNEDDETATDNEATANFLFEGNTVTGAGDRAYDVQVDQEGLATGVLRNNTATNSGNDGIRLNTENSGQLFVGVLDNNVQGTASGADGGLSFRSRQSTSVLCLRIEDTTSQNPSAANDFFFRRQDASAVLELFGLTMPLAVVGAGTTPLPAALTNLGNVGNSYRVQNQVVQVPTTCTFPASDFAPQLPSLNLPG